jgi:hypothetical protein
MSNATVQMEEWLEAHPDLWRAWRIPCEVKAEVRERLDQSNVNERVLMPDLDGLAAWLRRYYSPGFTDEIQERGGASMDGAGERVQQEGSMSGASPGGGPA